MPNIKEIYDAIDEIAPFSLSMDFDNTGILIGDSNQKVTTAILSLDCTSDTLKLAQKYGAELIITHHPIIFHPIKKLTENMIAYKLVHNSLAVISAHTNLDLADGGVNDVLANALGLKNLSGLEEITPGVFLGRIGEFAEPILTEDFAEYVKIKLKAQAVKYTNKKLLIQKIAVCSGSGGSCIAAALAAGADALVTGDVKHDQFIDAAEQGLAIIDAGHFDTEDIIIEPLRQALADKFQNVKFIAAHEKIIFSVK